jgi:transposase
MTHIEHIAQLRREGLLDKEIVNLLGVSRSVVTRAFRHLKVTGRPVPNTRRARSQLTPELAARRARIRCMWLLGVPASVMADHLGMKEPTLRGIASELKLRRPDWFIKKVRSHA